MKIGGALLRMHLRRDQLKMILLFGILLRVIIFIFQGAFNNDDHLAIVRYIHEYHNIPISGQFIQSNHPPLYYILASLLLPFGIKAVQALSLVFSIGTLTVIYLLIKDPGLIISLKIKRYCLLLACLLPQFIMFGNYISNDSLSFFIGSLLFLQVFRYINKPTIFNQNILAVYLGLGLLTKGTFLLFIPVLILLVVMVNARKKVRLKQGMVSLAIFIFIFMSLGSYKGINNMMHFRRPIVIIDKDPEWMQYQRPTYTGLKSWYDINILKLLRYPVLSEHTRHSYPLLLYGTFWYQYLPESDFRGNLTQARYLGSCIYALALLPTLLFSMGFFRIVRLMRTVFEPNALSRTWSNSTVYEAFSLFLLLSNFLVVIILGCKYDIYSAFQARFLFPSFFAFIVLLNAGLRHIAQKYAIAEKAAYVAIAGLYLLFLLYFGIEVFRKII